MLTNQQVKGPSNLTETLRLAISMASILVKVLTKRLNITVNDSDICKDVAEAVSMTHKVEVDGEQIHYLAFAKKTDRPPVPK